MDELDRGLVAVRDGDYIFVAWRRTGFDESDIRFNLYRSDNDGSSWQQIETNRYLTNFRDPNGTLNSLYRVAKVVNGNSCPVELMLHQQLCGHQTVWIFAYVILDRPTRHKDGDMFHIVPWQLT